MTISDFRDRHAGETVALLANGETLKRHRLELISCPTIGMNMSWKLLWPTYHIVTDHRRQVEGHEDVYLKLNKEGKLFVFDPYGSYWGVDGRLDGIKIRQQERKRPGLPPPPFPLDLSNGGKVHEGSCGSIAFLALQLAVWMGFTQIFILGLDLEGPHFHGEWAPKQDELKKQAWLFDLAAETLKANRPGVRVFITGSPGSLCTAFPKVPFDALLTQQSDGGGRAA